MSWSEATHCFLTSGCQDAYTSRSRWRERLSFSFSTLQEACKYDLPAASSLARFADLLQIFELPNLEQPVYSAPGLSALPPVLTTDDRQRRAAARETLTEVLFANLGDASSPSPYLVVSSISF